MQEGNRERWRRECLKCDGWPLVGNGIEVKIEPPKRGSGDWRMERTKLVEELARAICASDGWDPDGLNLNAPNHKQWELWIGRANATLARLDALGLCVVPKDLLERVEREFSNGQMECVSDGELAEVQRDIEACQKYCAMVREEDIEVTPDMIRAGTREYANWDAGSTGAHIVWAIYVEMEKARRGNRTGRPTGPDSPGGQGSPAS